MIETNEILLFLISAGLLLLAANIVFRRIVRKDYQINGRLSYASSFLELLVFAMYFSFPYIFLPTQWPWFWEFPGTSSYISKYLE